MSKHTQGPWLLAPHGNMPNGVTMYWVNKTTSIATANEADARLIATAPELLEALEEVSEFVDYLKEYNVPNDFPTDLPEKIKAAIAKARGE